VLLVACVAVYGPQLLQAGNDLRVPAGELSGELQLVDTVVIGSMLHASVSRSAWDDLAPADRSQGVTGLGDRARNRGLSAVYLTDGENNQLAIWTQGEGVSLSEEP
jgi:hypothetical protein